MVILGIETSCDETAVSIIKATGGVKRPRITVLAHQVASQTKIHEPWGGVVPMLAKREHGKNLVPLLKQALVEAKLLKSQPTKHKLQINPKAQITKIKKILEREPELRQHFFDFIPLVKRPKIDLIAVTQGPGLEPALWVGLNFARALGLWWEKPVLPVNHMEGHLVSALGAETSTKSQAPNHKIRFPAVALLVSGGHTELVLAHDWGSYQIIGQTRDDAAGEAFDKVARLLGLPYPGGPALSQLASLAKTYNLTPNTYSLPRPMLHSPDFDFSFSGLKTAVLYLVKKLEPLTNEQKQNVAVEFEQAVIDVLVAKTKRALDTYRPATLIAAGGVLANQRLVTALKSLVENYPGTGLLIPPAALSTDNATMIAAAGYLAYQQKRKIQPLQAEGRLML